MLIPSIRKTLNELSHVIGQLSNEDYSSPCYELSNATVGEHTRHIIELFQCLEHQYDSGQINYDLRKRDYLLQTNVSFAVTTINTVIDLLEKPNKSLKLFQTIDQDSLAIETNYHRELLYNFEHCIHHQALIKVALMKMDNISIENTFGVARSTIEYRKQCAQ